MTEVGIPPTELVENEDQASPKQYNFPIQIFNLKIQELIVAISRVLGVSIGIVASSLLMLTAGCIGRKRGVAYNGTGWIEYANLQLLNIGESGSGKSPTNKLIFERLTKKEAGWFREYQAAYNEFRANKKKDMGLQEPLLKQIVTDDVTTQGLLRALHSNPAGLLIKSDEANGLLSNRKIERERLMTGHDSGPWRSNRVKANGRYYIEEGTLSIHGLMTLETIVENITPKDVRTGFLPRFCFIFENNNTLTELSNETISNEHRNLIASITDNLTELEFGKDGKPIIIDLSSEARNIFRKWYNQQNEEAWPHLKSAYKAMIKKHQAHCLRFALNLHILNKLSNKESELEPVSKETLINATILADYIKYHKLLVYNQIHGINVTQKLTEKQLEVARAILNLCGNEQQNNITTAEITAEINRLRHESRQYQEASAVGKIISPLGLNKTRNGNERAWYIMPHHIANLRKRIKATEEAE